MKNSAIFITLLPALFPLAAVGTMVTTSSDEDDGSLDGGTGISLREAVKYSGPGSRITFAPELSGQTIRLTGGPLLIDKSLTIDASALPTGITLSADRTGNGPTADDSYVLLLTGGDLLLDSLILRGANCGESSGCITIQPSQVFSLTLDHCTLTRNAGYHASALFCLDYPTRPTGAITIRNSTIAGNSVVKGGVVQVTRCNLAIQNSTFSQNDANGGAIDYGTGSPPAILSISNSTISGNRSNTRAGGLNIYSSNSPATVYLNNTLCAGNGVTNIFIAPDVTISGTTNIFSGDPGLAPLGAYGGPTQTMPPLRGSPAIDTGGATTLTSDQRGFPRDSKPDIGAVEYQFSADLARFWERDFDGDGIPYGAELALGTNPGLADAADVRTLSVPTFDVSGHPVLSFGVASAPAAGTRWILTRSPDLSPGSFAEIFTTDLVSDSAVPGFPFVRTATRVTVTDENPFPGGGFYRFGARFEH